MILLEEINIKNFITARSGLYFKDHDLRGLQKAVEERIKVLGFDSDLIYYNYLINPETREDELRELLNLLTINHTYFFRNEAQFKALKERVLPEIVERKLKKSRDTGKLVKPSLRIWSAGCSSGEEPYSIAITLLESIPDLENWDIHILATDASSEALKRAKNGIYSSHSVKPVDKEILKRYFSVSGGSAVNVRYKINDPVKSVVQFGYFNLMDPDYPRDFDIIFCRNVVIYFELETTLKVMRMFHESLDDPGYIFIGYSETLNYMHDKFKMVAWDDAIYYCKTLKEGILERIKPYAKPIEKEKDIEKVLKEIAKEEVLAEIAESKMAAPSQKIEDLCVEIVKATHLREYSKALELAGQANTLNRNAITPYYLAAEVFVNQGKNDEAKDRLSRIFSINPLFAPAHYLFGCIYMMENDLNKAKESLRKAIYIDDYFLIAHFYIAQVFKTEGNTDKAMREYRNTLNILFKLGSEDIIAYSGGFNAATLMSICRDNLERLKLEE